MWFRWRGLWLIGQVIGVADSLKDVRENEIDGSFGLGLMDLTFNGKFCGVKEEKSIGVSMARLIQLPSMCSLIISIAPPLVVRM